MKEATGNLNLALVTIVSIGILVIFFYDSLWPMIESNMISHTKCDDAVCGATTSSGHPNQVACKYGEATIYCPYSG